jgi:hypothetical protein
MLYEATLGPSGTGTVVPWSTMYGSDPKSTLVFS